MYTTEAVCLNENCYNSTFAVTYPGKAPGNNSTDVMALFNIKHYCSIGCNTMAHRAQGGVS